MAAVPTAVPTPGPDPCGTADTDRDGIKNACDDNNGAARPVPFKTVNATVVSGDVFVKLPAGSASASQARPPKGFVRLEGAETIPVGSTLDTARGRVKIRSAANTRRKTQTGQFFRGRFVIRQVRRKRRSSSLVTDLRTERLVVPQDLPHDRVGLAAPALQEARAAAVRRRQGLVPDQRAQRRGDRPGHALGRPGPL